MYSCKVVAPFGMLWSHTWGCILMGIVLCPGRGWGLELMAFVSNVSGHGDVNQLCFVIQHQCDAAV